MMNEKAAKLLTAISFIERWACIIAFAVLALVLFLDVMSRTFVGNGIGWSHQAGVYANIVIALLGIGLAASNGSHLRPRFADNILPLSFEPVMRRLQPFVSALLLLLFAILAFVFVRESYFLQERSTVLHTLLWPVQSLLPLALSLASIRYLVYTRYPDLQPVPQLQAE
jgi:TRAP-type C4-dicarboxylate transport system permease small subunit